MDGSFGDLRRILNGFMSSDLHLQCFASGFSDYFGIPTKPLPHRLRMPYMETLLRLYTVEHRTWSCFLRRFRCNSLIVAC
ncbi:hypothetical protein LX13_002138 [Williamsia maris]|uniref:Uncharacterized protein n=1 Tax=Williamsia maris TaxID=72806 RepID=A0ABT1HDT2_9NOCA|nr:hypothetical protein [Williamsia maris]